jgi:hypothetical protein
MASNKDDASLTDFPNLPAEYNEFKSPFLSVEEPRSPVYLQAPNPFYP